MIILRKSMTFIFLVFCISGLATNCSKSSDDDEDEDDTETSGTVAGTGTTSTTDDISADTIDDLSLSTALNLVLPESLGGSSSGASLALQSSRKSMEACEVGRVIEDGLRSLRSAGNMFCHLEVEAASIEFGKKYNITITGEGGDDDDDDGGSDQMAIWVDNSKEASGELTVWMCEGGEVTQMIKIDAADEDSSKGTIIDRGSEEEHGSWAMAAKFDIGHTKAGRTFLSGAATHTMNSDSFRQQIVLDLVESGLNKVFATSTGSWEGNSFSNAGAAKINDEYGQVLFNNIGTHQGEEFSWTHRGYFNDEGYIVATDATPEFAEGGSLYVPDTDVPQFLPADFKVADFPTDKWDCVADNDLTIDMSAGDRAAAHGACEAGMDHGGDGPDCWSEEYEQSDVEHDIDETAQKDHDEFDDVEDHNEDAE